jgi:hypothetical protein
MFEGSGLIIVVQLSIDAFAYDYAGVCVTEAYSHFIFTCMHKMCESCVLHKKFMICDCANLGFCSSIYHFISANVHH